MLARWTLLTVVAAALASPAGCSSVREIDVSGIPHVTLDDPSNAKAIGKALEERGEVVVRLREGDALPMVVTFDLPVARLEAGKNVVRFSRDVWLYLSRETARISPDGRRWADLGDLAGMKDIFGFDGGKVQVGFRATEAEGAAITVAVEAR
jgi:hypothetical protein